MPPASATAVFEAAETDADSANKPEGRLAILDPFGHFVFVTPLGLRLFESPDALSLQKTLLAGDGPIARRLRRLARTLPVSRKPHLEHVRLRLRSGSTSLNIACCRVLDGEGSLLALWRAEKGAVEIESSSAPSQSYADQGANVAPSNRTETPSKARFLWSLDGEGILRFSDQSLVEALGANAPMGDETLQDLFRRVRIKNVEALKEAFARGETFSELTLEWPAPTKTMVRVKLWGTPAFGAGPTSRDYRGFGYFDVSLLERPSALPGIDRETSADDRPGGLEAPGDPLGRESDGELTSSKPDEPPQRRPDHRVRRAPSPERSAEIYVLRQANAPPLPSANIIPIRPDALEPAPDVVTRTELVGDPVRLSKSERDAFREIARALIGTPTSIQTAGEPRNFQDLTPRSQRSPSTDDLPSSSSEPEPQTAMENESDEGFGRDALTTLEHLPVGVLIARDARPVYANRMLLDMLACASFEDLTKSADIAEMIASRPSAQKSGAEPQGLTMIRSDGASATSVAHAQPIRWEGTPATLLVFLREAAAAPEPSAGLARSDLLRLLDVVDEGAVILDPSGAILRLNATAEVLLGFSKEVAVGEKLLKLLGLQNRPEVIAALDKVSQAANSEATVGPMRVVGRHPKGEGTPLMLTLSAFQGPETRYVCALFKDISLGIEAERKLAAALAASAAKTEFLAQVSHEIRTPLHAVLGFAEVMIEERFGPIGNDRYRDYLKDIHASGSHVMSLANDLLDLARIEAGKLELSFAPVDANSVIRECVSLMQTQAARDRIIMRLSLLDNLPQVVVDERALRQIMLNLISNAVKYNEPGGQVIVSTAVDSGGQPVIRVRDTGVGMSEAEIEIALEPFGQIDKGRRSGGVGLGLPLTRALVEANKAEFSIRSQRDQGTLIEIAFPRIEAAQ